MSFHRFGSGAIFGVASEDGQIKPNTRVALLDRANFNVLGTTVTASDGGFAFYGLNADYPGYIVIGLDDDEPYKNAVIYDRVQPTPMHIGYKQWANYVHDTFTRPLITGFLGATSNQGYLYDVHGASYANNYGLCYVATPPVFARFNGTITQVAHPNLATYPQGRFVYADRSEMWLFSDNGRNIITASTVSGFTWEFLIDFVNQTSFGITVGVMSAGMVGCYRYDAAASVPFYTWHQYSFPNPISLVFTFYYFIFSYSSSSNSWTLNIRWAYFAHNQFTSTLVSLVTRVPNVSSTTLVGSVSLGDISGLNLFHIVYNGTTFSIYRNGVNVGQLTFVQNAFYDSMMLLALGSNNVYVTTYSYTDSSMHNNIVTNLRTNVVPAASLRFGPCLAFGSAFSATDVQSRYNSLFTLQASSVPEFLSQIYFDVPYYVAPLHSFNFSDVYPNVVGRLTSDYVRDPLNNTSLVQDTCVTISPNSIQLTNAELRINGWGADTPGTTDFTYMLFVKFSSLPTTVNATVNVWRTGLTSSITRQLRVRAVTSTNRIFEFVTNNGNNVLSFSDYNIPLNTWLFVCLVRENASSFKLYIAQQADSSNAQLSLVQTVTFTPPITGSFTLADTSVDLLSEHSPFSRRLVLGQSGQFNGRIQWFVMYPSALPLSRIQTIFNARTMP